MINRPLEIDENAERALDINVQTTLAVIDKALASIRHVSESGCYIMGADRCGAIAERARRQEIIMRDWLRAIDHSFSED